MLDLSPRIYMCELLKVSVCFKRIRLYVMLSDHIYRRLFYIPVLNVHTQRQGRKVGLHTERKAGGVLKGILLFKLNSCQLGSTLIGAPGWCSQKGTPHPGSVSMFLVSSNKNGMFLDGKPVRDHVLESAQASRTCHTLSDSVYTLLRTTVGISSNKD